MLTSEGAAKLNAMENMDMDIEIELLISLVEERPVLWNKTADGYKNRNFTVLAWNEVCSILNEGFNLLSDKEKSEFSKYVIKKWTNVKDSWLKWQKKFLEQTSCGVKPKSIRKYIYQDQLEFLKRDTVPRETGHSSAEEKSESRDTDSILPSTSYSFEERSSTKGDALVKKRKIDDADREIVINLHPSDIAPLVSSEDRHLSFFKGILPSLQELNEEETLNFQIGVLYMLQNIRKARTDE